jgi:hypothetical protein
MALIPANSYPGQIVTPGGSYPLGKARNEVVEGDGSGTPLEQDWLNDLFGFEQALLAAAGITASGAPDQVGASQYLAAVQSLINKFAEHEHTWFANQEFNANLTMATGALRLNPDYEVAYTTPPTRKVQVPLVAPVISAGWSSVGLPTPGWASSTGSAIVFMIGRSLLPSGANIKNVRAYVSTSLQVELSVRQVSYDTSGPNDPVAGTAYTDSFTPSGTEPHVLTVNIPTDTIIQQNSTSQLQISIDPVSGTGCALRWIEIEYTDQFISNY